MAYDAGRFAGMFRSLADRLEREKAHLCELDGQIGDADHGIAMAQGSAAAAKAAEAAGGMAPADVFNAAAKAFLSAVGASCGPLYATAFMRAGAALKGREAASADDVVAAVQAMAKGIADRGKAETGEKTMIDAWAPAAEALGATYGESGDLSAALTAAAERAREGAESTRDMIATKGRSARLGERARGHVDPGAASAAIVVEVIAESLSG